MRAASITSPGTKEISCCTVSLRRQKMAMLARGVSFYRPDELPTEGQGKKLDKLIEIRRFHESVFREPTAEYDYVLRLLLIRTTASPLLPELPPPLLRRRLSSFVFLSRLRVYHSSYLVSATILSPKYLGPTPHLEFLLTPINLLFFSQWNLR